MKARHPSTARFVSRKLAIYFYGDQPPEALIARTAAAFSASDGDIARTLHALFTAPEFSQPLPPGEHSVLEGTIEGTTRVPSTSLASMSSKRPTTGSAPG